MTQSILEIAWPRRHKSKILPVFIPFLGCRSRCIYCAQDLQTGVACKKEELYLQFDECFKVLSSRDWETQPELAFYGGTFMSLPEHLWIRCLEYAHKLKNENLISGFRCSTRPDSVTEKRLAQMQENGCVRVELGIQSFNQSALDIANRGYATEICYKSCETLHKHGLPYVAQLMPGMPGVDHEVFMNDVRTALELKASALRFYPCLVIAGTRLERLWRDGQYKPWEIGDTIETLAQGWVLAKRKNIPVIRIGLAPQAKFTDSILAGPFHPAIGNRITGKGMFLHLNRLLAGKNPISKELTMYCPAWTQGEVWGWQKELKSEWEKLAIKKIFFWEEDRIKVAMA